MSLPKPSGPFEWVQEPWGSALRCTPLAADHCFTTRQLSFDGADPRAGWADLCRVFGVEASALVRLRQVHRADVFEAAAGNVSTGDGRWPEADVVISGDPAVVLTVRAADCVPVLLADPQTGTAAAVHAGWRGTAAGAVIAAVEALTRRAGVRPENLIAAAGPSIGPCCYSVGDELITKFGAHPEARGWFRRDGDLRLNLWQATRDQLRRAGVRSDRIHISELCTTHHPDVFHSYRRDGKAAGRLVAAIRTPGRPTP
jgi:YfiH family protein